jgi:hypothetical protein
MGKGSDPRPVNKKKFDSNFDRIFGSSDGGCLSSEKIDCDTVERSTGVKVSESYLDFHTTDDV